MERTAAGRIAAAGAGFAGFATYLSFIDIGIPESTRSISVMSRSIPLPALLGLTAFLLLSACNNQYGPPPESGKPTNWGQQHYLDNQRYQQMNQDRMP